MCNPKPVPAIGSDLTTMLHNAERQDLRAVLSAALHALTYPVMFDGNANVVRRIQFWLDALRTPEEIARLDEMKARLAVARSGGACHPGE